MRKGLLAVGRAKGQVAVTGSSFLMAEES